ncbi:MAG: protein kinase [Acidobacteria bacterium]|nr:protein kinase [Acidobacteriota bacterium]
MVQEEPFELLEPLGTGGFAHTYRARVLDEDLAADYGTDEVALKIPLNAKKGKILHHELELNASIYLRIKNMDLTNIVRYLGVEIFRGQIVMAMEFVPQGSLRKLMGGHRKPKRLPVEQAISIAIGTLNGLAVIHRERVFHRDIKPENILMCGDTPKVADLGISRMLASNELASSTVGTIYYMSPEILGPEGAAFPSDIWSMGVTLYEMVTAKLPFGDMETPIGTMADLIRTRPHVSARECNPEVPESLSRLIDRALNKNPDERFGSAGEMIEALRSLAGGPPQQVDEELLAVRQKIGSGVQTELELAERLLRARLVKDPKCATAYQYMGELLNLRQCFAQAISQFETGLKHSPDSPMLHWDLAMAHHRLGHKKEAAAHLRKVLDLPSDASLRRHATTLLKVLDGGVS